jgi:hypothetical protein
MKTSNYIAISSKDDYWICLSKPCEKKNALLFRDCLSRDEFFHIKTVKQVKNHKKVIY